MINFGSEQVIEAGGKRYTLDKARLRYIRAFRDWIAKQVGDPFAEAEKLIDKLPAAEAMQLVKEAEAVKRDLDSFSMGCDLAKRFIITEQGLLFMIGQLLSKHHPGLDEDSVEEVAEEVARNLIEFLVTSLGSVPNEAGPAAEVGEPAANGQTGGASINSPSSMPV